MPTLKERLSFIVEGSNVLRFHTRPGIRHNTVGHHSHGVVMLIWLVSDQMASSVCLMGGATHDLAEQVTSDVSSPAKRFLRIREMLQQSEDIVLNAHDFKFVLSAKEYRWLAIADLFDLLLYCCDEIALGNKYSNLVLSRVVEYISNELDLEPHQRDIYNAIIELHKENSSHGGPQFDCYYPTTS